MSEFNPFNYTQCTVCGKIIEPIGDHKCQVASYVSDSTNVDHKPSRSEKIKIVHNFVKKISEQQDLPPEIQKIINENFWKLL